MEPVLRWCHANQYPVEFGDLRLDAELNAIYEHFVRWGSGRHLPNPRKCVALGYPFYHALFSAVRFTTCQLPVFADVLKHYSELADALESTGTSIDHRFWDQRVMRFERAQQRGEVEVLAKNLDIDEHPYWPIRSSQGPLAASAHVLGLAAKHLKDVLASVYETGAWFEEVVADELSHMRVPIVARNVLVPNGEIDLIAFDAHHYYVTEEKDYGPRGKHGYFSSAEYADRLGSLERYARRFADRAEWVSRNREGFSIPNEANIKPLLILSTDEPDLQFPAGVEVANVRRLCGLFGGDPIDPLLEYEDLEQSDSAKPATKPEPQRPPSSKAPSKRKRPRKLQGLSNSQSLSVFELVTTRFGSVAAYQIYRIAWEVTRARESDSVSVMELSAVPVRRPPSATTQYVSYVAHRADHLPLNDVAEALRGLTDLGWVRQDDGMLTLTRSVDKEMYRFKGRKLLSVERDEDADILLFVPTARESDSGVRVLGLVDAIIHPNRVPVLVLLKEEPG